MAYAQECLGGTHTPEQQRALVNPRPTRLGTIMGPDGFLTTDSDTTNHSGARFAPGTVLTNNSTTKARIQVAGWATYYVLVKLSAATGTGTVNGFPMLANATKDDTAGTRAPTAWGLPTSLTSVSTTAVLMTVTAKGEEFFEVEIVVSNGGSDALTIDYVDVFGV